MRWFVDDRSLRLLVHAFITLRLDYCNGLFANCSVAVRGLERLVSAVTADVRFMHW